MKDDEKKQLDLAKVSEELDKKLRHEPVELYCLGCGRMISDNFTGGLWSYTCMCRSVVFGSKRGVLIPSSLICGYKNYATCKECKDEKEHIKKVLKGCLGNSYEKIDFKDPDLAQLRMQAIKQISEYASKGYYEKIQEHLPKL